MVVASTPEPAPGFDWVGSFRYLLAEGTWEWSDAVARMHGYEPGSVTPTTELILSHKHPDDKAAVSEIIAKVLREGAAFSSRHRIIDTSGAQHVVVVVGDELRGPSNEVVGTSGFYIDVTESFEADMQRSVSRVVAEVEQRRAVINQAIGIIRMTYGVSAERAFEVLVWRSQDANVKLRQIAENVVERLSGRPLDPAVRGQIDHVLLTAHADAEQADS